MGFKPKRGGRTVLGPGPPMSLGGPRQPAPPRVCEARGQRPQLIHGMALQGVGVDSERGQLSNLGVLSGQALLENVAFFFVVLALGVATVVGALLWSVLRWWTRRRTDATARRRLRAMG